MILEMDNLVIFVGPQFQPKWDFQYKIISYQREHDSLYYQNKILDHNIALNNLYFITSLELWELLQFLWFIAIFVIYLIYLNCISRQNCLVDWNFLKLQIIFHSIDKTFAFSNREKISINYKFAKVLAKMTTNVILFTE